MNKVMLSELKLKWLRSSHGMRLILASVLVNIAVIFLFLVPMHQSKSALETKLVQQKSSVEKPPVLNAVIQNDPLEQLTDFESGFPFEKSLPDILAQIHEILSRAGLKISEAEYRMVDLQQSRLKGYQITMPIRGQYVNIIDASLAILNQIPSISLNNISFQRKAISDGQTEAIFSMTLYLRRI